MEKNLNVYGVHVYKKGEGSVAHRFRNDENVEMYSASKTFTAVAVGICQDEGGLKLSDTVLSFFPEYASSAAPGSETITIRDLLHMCSGKEHSAFTVEQEKTMDLAEALFRDPLVTKPGDCFVYTNTCPYMLGRVIEKVSGLNMRDYLMPRLFEPFGLHNPQWQTCPRGHSMGGTGLLLKTADLEKLGILLLHKGLYEGRRIVSEAYVNAMYDDIVPNTNYAYSKDPESTSGYGYQVWRCTRPGAYRAAGKYGQHALVIPDKDAVITYTSHYEREAGDIIRAAFEGIVPLL
jgi:CubicO group peptidase (beta-lactamase class C family)